MASAGTPSALAIVGERLNREVMCANDDRRAKYFIDVVKKEDLPKFDPLLKDFEKDLAEIKDALK